MAASWFAMMLFLGNSFLFASWSEAVGPLFLGLSSLFASWNEVVGLFVSWAFIPVCFLERGCWALAFIPACFLGTLFALFSDDVAFEQ